MAEQPGAPVDDPSPGSDAGVTETSPEEEPVVTGTLFIMLVFLMALAALWLIMYLTLIER